VATLEQLIASVNAQTPTVELVAPETIGWSLDAAPFEPPEALPPRRELTLNWLWSTLWGKVLVDPTAGEIRRRAAEHDRQYPESHEARYRSENPDWLREKAEGYREFNSEQRWRRVLQFLNATGRAEDGWRLPDRRRIAWLKNNEAAIRPLLERAKAAHYRRYEPR
jgi:hypothetical protein